MSGSNNANKRQNMEVMDEAVARALSDNLAPLKRTVEDLQRAFADLVAQCDTNRGSAALPAMLRAQSSAASIAAGLGVLSSFVAMTLRPGDRAATAAAPALGHVAEPHFETPARVQSPESQQAPPPPQAPPSQVEAPLSAAPAAAEPAHVAHTPAPPPPTAEPATQFDLNSLSVDLQELHRRAKRVAKVAMQDIKMLKPKDVRQARENKDICVKLRDDLDKARKEYDRRFKPILDHPIDYFHDSMVAILADGDAEALGTYPYPSPAMRH